MSRIVESSQQTQQQESTQSRPKSMVQRLMDATSDLPTFLKDLLTMQAVLVAGTEAAAFILERGEQGPTLRPIQHIRPDESDQQTREAALKAFQNLVGPCAQQGKDGAIDVGSPDGGESQYCLITVLRDQSMIVAVTAVITRCRDLDRAKQRLTSMQLVAGYFELFATRQYMEQARLVADRHQHVLQFASAIAMAEGFESAAMSLCNELATRTGASRVALGWLKGQRVRIKAFSHTEKFDKKQELVVALEKVMEECYDQEEPVRYDPEGNCTANVTRAAAEHSRAQGGNIVMSAPLRRREEIVGVLTLEFPARSKVDEQTDGAVSVAADILAPQLYDRYENDRVIFVKAGHSIRDLAKMGMGPKHMGVKLLILAAIGLICFVSLYKPMYRVKAPFQLVAQEPRTLCAPYDGVLENVLVRPGQQAKAGQVLAQMDTYELKMRLAAAEADARRYQADAAKYQPMPDKMADYDVARYQQASAEASARLYRYQISEATIKAPFDCIVLRGDLFERKMTPVKQGDTLFELARSEPGHKERIAVEAELQVPERDVQEVKRVYEEQQSLGAKPRLSDGKLATASVPSDDYGFKITRIVPQGQAKDGENMFSVFCTIESPPAWMFPGEGGEARVQIEHRRFVWIWTHRLTDWIKLKAWAWLGL